MKNSFLMSFVMILFVAGLGIAGSIGLDRYNTPPVIEEQRVSLNGGGYSRYQPEGCIAGYRIVGTTAVTVERMYAEVFYGIPSGRELVLEICLEDTI